MNGAPFKMDQICNFYYGETVTTLQKNALVSTGNEVVVFGTTMGAIGALFAFDSKEVNLHKNIQGYRLLFASRDVPQSRITTAFR